MQSSHRRAFGRAAGTSLLFLLTITHPSQAQGARTGAEGRSAEAATAASSDTTVPTPQVSDAMLAPPPPPPRPIESWDAALELIRSQSPDYRTSAQAVERVIAQKRIALAAVLPTLNGTVSYTHQFLTETVAIPGIASFVTPAPDVWSAAALASWSVINPRGLYGIGSADRAIDVAKLSFDDRRRLITTSAVHAMLATLAAERVAELNRVGLRSALERLALTQARQQYGQGTALDVDRAEQDVASSRAQLIRDDESLRQAREALGVALGSPVAMGAPGDLNLDSFESSVAHTCQLNDNLERRPDVRAAHARVDLALRSVRDVELQFLPSLSVSAQLTQASAANLAPDRTLWVGGTLNVPLFDGGARYGALRDARAALDQAREALVNVQLDAIVGSDRARRSVAVVGDERGVARQQRDLAERIDRRTREGYAHGLGTSLDLVISARALRDADINLAILDFQFAEARANALLVNAECVY